MTAPYSKEQQVGAGRPKRYRRKVASPKQWAAIRAEKLYDERCRCCGARADSLHHLVSRAQSGDDVPENLVPLCGDGVKGCHGSVERRTAGALRSLAESLTDAEYGYCVGKLGEGALGRLFGVLDGAR